MSAIGEVLMFGIGVALSPAAIIAVVLMLTTPGGRAGAFVFVGAWSLSLGTVGALTIVLADTADAGREGDPAGWVIGAQIALGLLLLVVAVRQWRGREDDAPESELPAWMRKVDGLTPPRAAVMAVLLASVKPKNLLLTIGAALAVAELGVGVGEQAGGLVVFVILGSLAPGVPLALSLLMGERASRVLEGTREWMVRENATIVAVVCVIFAAKLLGDALVGA